MGIIQALRLPEFMRELVKRIESCKLCALHSGLRDLVDVESKPYIEFQVYEHWVLSIVKCLFIAESLPCNPNRRRFFYNPEVRDDLRKPL